MNSSCVGWICGGTNVPGGNVACQENDGSLSHFGTYVWPRMFQTIPSMPVPALVTPAVIACMGWLLQSRDTVSFKFSPAAVLVVDAQAFNHESKGAEMIPHGTRAPS